MIVHRSVSLRWKIPLRVIAAVIGTAAAVTAALVVWEYDEMRRNLQGHATSLGRVLANTLVAPVMHDDIWRAYEILQSARETYPAAPELHAEIVLVTDADNKVFVSSKPREFPIGSNPAIKGGAYAQLSIAAIGGDALSQRVLEPQGSPVYFVISPMVADGVTMGHVILGYSKASFLPRFFGIVQRAALVTVLVLLIIVPVSWAGASRTGKPLLLLAEAMRRLPGELDESRLGELPKSNDEIGQLTAAFQRMVRELKNKQELERQMVVSERLAAVGRLTAGIAHEINNPLAGMLTAIDTYQRHGSGNDPLALSTLSLLKRGLTQIRHTVGALLVESKAEDRPFAPEDVEDLLILAEAEAHGRSIGVIIESKLEQALPLPATLMRQILLNLLLNAINAADARVAVRLFAPPDAARLHLAVDNDGKHIERERMNTLFEPFSSDRESGHGLGLWIVYQIVQQLGGDIQVESLPGRTSFKVDIPYGDNA